MNGLMLILIIVFIILLILLWVVGTYNKLIALNNLVNEAFSTMDVYLKKRFDLIPNLVETVKKYASHEKEVFTKVADARKEYANARNLEEKNQGQLAMKSAIGSLFAVAEAYPELKANENFIQLQNDLTKIEEDIAQSRKYYNGQVREYTNKIEMFPSKIIAGIFGFKKKPMFEVGDTIEREAVKVSFDN